ncbi:BA75_04186T0 [Komagataella pastoris]|uniref:BA75_04186T0 n=1 Tax=Komagataella pastoris TaxID=4922 RepID=A0A1B2JG71_PICPA|nr:BA75_04186T0 [Komagataella pastoris]
MNSLDFVADSVQHLLERTSMIILPSSGLNSEYLQNESLPVTCSWGCFDEEGWGPMSPYSDLTTCFINGALINLSSLFLILVGGYQLAALRRLKTTNTNIDWKLPLKLVLISFQIILNVNLAANYFYESVDFKHDIKFITPVFSSVALIVALFAHYVEVFKTSVPLGSLLFYWLFTFVSGCFNLGNLVVRSNYANPTLVSTVFTIVIALILLILESAFSIRPASPTGYEIFYPMSPFDTANVFSRITFQWMSGLMKKGHESFLGEEDLPPLPKYLQAKMTSEKFSYNWTHQLRTKKDQLSLTWALAKSFGAPFLVGGIFKACQDVLAFTQPQLLRILIKFVNDYNDSDGTVPLTKGFMIVISMFLVSIVQTGCLHQYFQRAFDMGMKIKTALTSSIYSKSLTLSNEEKSKYATGDIVNLMSVDTQRLQDLVQNIQIIWSGPFQIILCLFSLHGLMGNSMWMGVVIMIIMIPLNGALARYQKKLQKIQMKNKDQRTRIVSEILNNIKSLKLYGWESPYKERLTYVRNEKELKNLKKMGIFQAFSTFTWNCAPFLVSCSTFAVFVLTNKDTPLTTDIVFPALALFNLLSFPLAVIPMVITSIVEAQVAISRLTKFLTGSELQNDSVIRLPRSKKIGETAVRIKSGQFLWCREPYKVALKDVNFAARKGELSCIVGKVGAGKSSLIRSILGDLYKSEGTVIIRGSVAYVSQVPWIMNGSIKENILFGCKYEPEFYKKTLEACALDTDLSILTDGDATQVGEKGISLSGGQKARLSLARAVYARADVYLMDDVLSAVDEHVGKHITTHVLGPGGLLSTKCRVLATNNINVLKHSNHVSLIQEGSIIEEGNYQTVVSNSSSKLSILIKEFSKSSSSSDNSGTNSTAEVTPVPSQLGISKSVSDTISLRRASLESFSKSTSNNLDEESKQKINKEHHEQGQVKFNVYKVYANACNPKAVCFLLFLIVVAMFTSVLGNIWLKHWSEVNTKYGGNPNIALYLGTYFALGIASSLLSLLKTAMQWIYCTISGSKYLHKTMTDSVFRAPMEFFETTPIGRILNRFSSDIYKVDEILGRVFEQFFTNAVKVFFTVAVICYSTWQFIFMILPILMLYVYYQQYYLRTSRELRRLDSVSRSPIFAHFQETLTGTSTIRAYNQLDRFRYMNQSKVDFNISAYHPAISANRWLAVRLEFLGSIIILGASGLAIFTLKTGGITAGMVGLSVSYALQITQSLNWIVRMTVEVETNIVSVERIIEYSTLKSEAPAIIEDNRPPKDWPFEGKIEFKNYSTRYREGLDLVLKDINLSINPKEKIGIVGRTGAGKSSLTLALFRIIEATQGSIWIDGIDTSKIGLEDLRHKLSIIPQDSQVFAGTLRENLDPTNQYSDDEIWKAIELAHLKPLVISMAENDATGLEVHLAEGGSNLSVGQRQLICLARALLIKSHILVLDEATAAVDVETDQVLQETIRKEFKDRTILTIAHRLNTIMDSDRIIVLDNGRIAEFDTPENLLKNKESLFYSLSSEGGTIE